MIKHPVTRNFEKGYQLILNSKYNRIKLVSLIYLLTIHPIYIYLVTFSYLISFCIISMYLFTSFLTYLVLRRTTNYFGKSKISLSLSISAYSIGSFIDLILSMMFGRVILFIGPLLFFSLFSTVMYVFIHDEKFFKKLAKLCTLPLTVIPSQTLSTTFLLQTLSIRALMTIDLVVFITSIISARCTVFLISKLGGRKMIELTKGILESMSGYVNRFEESLKTFCTKMNTEIHTFMIKTQNNNIVITIPYVHTGPINGMSSTHLIRNLVSLIENEFNTKTIYLHGIGSHELDVIGEKNVQKIINEVKDHVSRLLNYGDSNECIDRPRIYIKNSIKIVSIPLKNKKLLIVSRINKASDDIPYQVYLEMKKRIHNNQFIIIDAQNGYEGDSSWTIDDIKSLVELTIEIAKQNCKCELISIGYSENSYCNIPEVGQCGIKVLVLNYSTGDRVLLIVYDSNNIKRDLYKKLCEYFQKKYEFSIVEILTTDNHELVSFIGSRGYFVLGETTKFESILKLTEDLICKALRNIENVYSINYRNSEIQTLVLGVEGFTKLRNILSEYLRYSWLFILIIMVIPVTIILSILPFVLF